MERLLGGGLRTKGVAVATSKQNFGITKGKFKLHTSKDPLPLLAKKQLSRDVKPKAKFVTATEADVSRVKHANNTKSTVFATNSFVRPPTAAEPPKRSGGFKFTKYQSKSKDKNSTDTSFAKKTTGAFATTKPFLGLPKTVLHATNAANKESLLKAQAKGELPFPFRADTHSSTAKKRKAMETIAHQGANNTLPSKIGRAPSKFGLVLNRTISNKENIKDVTSEARIENAKSKHDTRRDVQIATRIGEISVKTDGNQKRGLLLASAKAGPPLKRSKSISLTALQPLKNIERVDSGSSSSDTILKDRDVKVSSPRILNPKTTPMKNDCVPENEVLLSTNTEDLPFTDDEFEDEVALKLLCTVDDDNENEFLNRAAAMKDFIDQLGLEQRQIRNRLLDVHADISGSLLDALTDLMAEEAGIGIEKLAFDDVDIDVNDPIVQDELQVFQG